MAKVIRRYWTPSVDPTGLPRAARRGCYYDAYVPDVLSHRDFAFGATEAADITDAEREIAQFDRSARVLVDTEALARILLRAEAVASSKIEGLEVGVRRLLRADAAKSLGEEARDVTAAEVLGNVEAMSYVLNEMKTKKKISLEILLRAHRLLLASSSIAAHGGKLRDAQNWIGGSDYNPCSAQFVPPPPEMVRILLTDLCDFANQDDMPAVAQAAIAHAQFETIHPFVDGNGRVGRVLIHMILRRRQLATMVFPPVSLVLATLSRDYLRGLTATRYIGRAKSREATEGMNLWVGIFAGACRRAVVDAMSFETLMGKMQTRWRQRLGAVRANSALDLLLTKIPAFPILTVKTSQSLIKRSDEAVNQAIARLVKERILVQAHVGQRRNRVFEATEVIAAFTNLERRLATPTGNTKGARPARRVPQLRNSVI